MLTEQQREKIIVDQLATPRGRALLVDIILPAYWAGILLAADPRLGREKAISIAQRAWDDVRPNQPIRLSNAS